MLVLKIRSTYYVFRKLHADVPTLSLLIAHSPKTCSSRDGHAELVSASGSEPYLVLLRGQILKQVQDDHLLWAIVICYIEEQKDMFFWR